MEATELMIGDWVEVIDSDHLKYVKVRNILDISIVTERCEYESEVINLDNINPISLTNEILEKNGFERTNDYHFFDGDEYYEMELREISDSIWFVEYTDLEFSMPSQRMTVCNVHELQHALKLCGIDKNIEL